MDVAVAVLAYETDHDAEELLSMPMRQVNLMLQYHFERYGPVEP